MCLRQKHKNILYTFLECIVRWGKKKHGGYVGKKKHPYLENRRKKLKYHNCHFLCLSNVSSIIGCMQYQFIAITSRVYMRKCENGKKIYEKRFVSMFANFVIVSVIVAAGISIAVSVKGNGISLNCYN